MQRYWFISSVVQPILIKQNELFLVTERGGEIDENDREGAGLFYRDTRYLSRCIMQLGGDMMALMSDTDRHDHAVIELSNEEFEHSGGKVPRLAVVVRWDRDIDGAELVLRDKVLVRSFSMDPLPFSLSLRLLAKFEDMMQLRGSEQHRRGELREPDCREREARFAYAGADGIERRLTVQFSTAPSFEREDDGGVKATFDLDLEPQESWTLGIDFRVEETGRDAALVRPLSLPAAGRRIEMPFRNVSIETDDRRLNGVFTQAFEDLRLLTTRFDTRYIAGGAPWYVSPFGRDSLITSLQTLPFDPDLAADTARQMALRQGRRERPSTGEEPGKILHELRFGEMANLGEIEQHPSYRSIDSTPLFLILLAEHARWTGGHALWDELREQADAAVGWMRRALEQGGGYLAYAESTGEGPRNEGWRDSQGGVLRRDGSQPEPPIALCEVQGYAFAALQGAARRFRARGEIDRAEAAEREAEELRARFNRDFWMEDEGCFCIALEKGGKQVASVTSNSGQALWSGIAEAEKGKRACARLKQSDMWSGWGVRTLSDRSPGFNPIHYHQGDVWPFDNSLILAGLRRYGCDAEASELFSHIFELAAQFAHGRLPEFIAGMGRESNLFPSRSPMAGPVQAWSSGAILYMLISLLGAKPDESAGELQLTRPMLPQSVTKLRIEGLRVGGRSVGVALERGGDGEARIVGGKAAEPCSTQASGTMSSSPA
jgi:glycogen debranching enzyme